VPTILAAQSVQGADASGIFALSWLLIGLPAFGALVLLLGGRRTDKIGPLLGTAMPLASFVIGALQFMALLDRDAEDRGISQHLYTWISVGGFNVDAGLLVDQLSMCFDLFIAAMLLLVLADSYLVLYVGWEGVGLASYLLIGFWNYVPEYAAAAKKAFVANRVGDFGLSIAIMIMFWQFGTVSFSGVFGAADGASEGALTAIGLMLLLAACGKSAQFPLQSWLGDAMAGPTPVSALIHAATMVTAGVYLIVRSAPVFEGAPNAQLVVVIVGAVTLLFGAIIGTAKDDIKKALAASTMSQIGYMMLAAGLGPVGYAFAIFHLLTHGFFKAGMFLGAGSVMHGMNNQVDMRRFGGLSAAMKVTWLTFGLGWLAIIGFPGLSGFWSKDKIIEAAFEGDGWRPWVFGLAALIGAGITAFYMTRLFFMTFHGERRWTDDVHPHESPAVMTVPLMVLALGSAFLGLLLGPTGAIQNWLEPVVGDSGEEATVLPVALLTTLTVVLVAVGVGLAWSMYLRREVPVTPPTGSVLARAARRDLYQDAVNESLLMRPGQYLTRFLVYFDNKGVDGAVNGLAALIGGTSGRFRRLQTGFVRSYALSMFGGAAILVGAMLLVRM
jgi:NADH-quinone oxidoreductase subunit L